MVFIFMWIYMVYVRFPIFNTFYNMALQHNKTIEF
jgi:hypothetical protein